jgi:hypothetical protein
MATVTPVLSVSFIYALCVTEDINWRNFVKNVFIFSKPCPSSLDIISLRGPIRIIWDVPLFHVSPSFKNCPTARCATTTNPGCSNFDNSRRHIIKNRFDIIFSFITQGVLINCFCAYCFRFCFICFLFIILYNLCSYGVQLGCGCDEWIGLAQDRDRWRALVSAVRNLRVP